ncbi:MAG: riboflavin synthase [Planctomycetota bacterium]|jgi:riboflavin synthase
MFTGLIETMGEIAVMEPREGGIRLWIESAELAPKAGIGDSVAVDGCCLTVVERTDNRLAFDVIPESLRRTTMGGRGVGDKVNLELPLRPTDRLGGHFVQGHVDAVAEVTALSREGDDVIMSFALPDTIREEVVEKGSVALDGVSMTVAGVDEGGFSVALIPHTLAVTTLGIRQPGDRVNVEGDILAKYVVSLLQAR